MITRADARRRDIPRNCTCRWEYRAGLARWVCVQHLSCPWHLRAARERTV